MCQVIHVVSYYGLGCVDLKSCDCIYEKQTFKSHQNVLVIKTICRYKPREYHFAADTWEQMNNWILQLTSVLQMVPVHDPNIRISGAESLTLCFPSSI